MREVSWPAEDRLGAQEGLCYMELLETGMKEIVNPVPDVRAYNVVDLTS